MEGVQVRPHEPRQLLHERHGEWRVVGVVWAGAVLELADKRSLQLARSYEKKARAMRGWELC